MNDKVGDYLIFERNKNSDLFVSNIYYKNQLLNINLESIPLSEGLHKGDVQRGAKSLMRGNNIEINKFLSTTKTYSENLLFILQNTSKDDYIDIRIKSNENVETTIRMKSCHENHCLLNLSGVPLFYRTRILKSMEFGKNVHLEIVKVDDRALEKLW